MCLTKDTDAWQYLPLKSSFPLSSATVFIHSSNDPSHVVFPRRIPEGTLLDESATRITNDYTKDNICISIAK